jgi:hypothetical protein
MIWGALIALALTAAIGMMIFVSGKGTKSIGSVPISRNPAMPGDVSAGDRVACAQDAKQCPDGSSVSRVAPKCEFGPCPESGVPVPAAVVPAIPATLEPQAFSDTKNNFKINVPKGWTQDVKTATPMFLSPKQDAQGALKFSANLGTSAIPLKLSGVSDLDHCITGVELAKILPNYKTTEDQKTTVNGIPVRIIGGTFDYGDYHLQNKQLLAIKNGKYYTITMTALASTWSTYRDMFQVSLLTFDAN